MSVDSRPELRQSIGEAASGAVIHLEILMKYVQLQADDDAGYAARCATGCLRQIGELILALEARNAEHGAAP
jgi:hypothetical protein